MKARLAAKLFDSGPCDLSGIAATSADLDDLTGDDLADRVVAVNQVERPQGQSTDGLVLGNCSRRSEADRAMPIRRLLKDAKYPGFRSETAFAGRSRYSSGRAELL
jgi:hypothetical protein